MKKENITHTLNLDEFEFPISHIDRRLYKFEDWSIAKRQVMEVLESRVRDLIGLDIDIPLTIDIESAHPFRRSRLGNFYIEVRGTVDIQGKVKETLEDLKLNSIPIDDYITHDQEELKIREGVERKFSKDQYEQEKSLRVQSLKLMEEEMDLCLEFSIDDVVEGMMIKEGWTKTQNNKIYSRVKRVDKRINL